MSGRGFDAPISEQISRLNRSLQSRDKRREQQKRQRQLQAESEEGQWETQASEKGDATKKPRTGARATGGIALGPAGGASVTQLPPPKIFNCEICNATFRSEVQHRQHLHGPVHRKAVAKLEALRRNDPHARHGAAAEAALQAAHWQSHGGHVSRFRSTHAQPAASRGGPIHCRTKEKGLAASVPSGPSHEELVARLRADKEPLNIDGWVPPSIPPPAPPVAADQTGPATASIQTGEGVQNVEPCTAIDEKDSTGESESDAPSDDVDANDGGGVSLVGLVGYSSGSQSLHSEDSSDETRSEGNEISGSFF
ncbi:hypothetical protein BSKO_09844 [Bryopsis sp. KO-2023]|nr:hypothetical protein BSKO_09844 [Bryopsis sp. KO-2023]